VVEGMTKSISQGIPFWDFGESESRLPHFYIKKSKSGNGCYYYLVENYRQGDKNKFRYITSFGRDPPIFYQPTLVQNYCEEYLKTITPGSVDLIIDDPPYGITRLPWDEAPDWDVLAGLYHNVLNDNGLVYIFGKQPSLIEVYNSFRKYFDFRFEIIWNRNNVPWSSNFKPLPIHENIFVFCKKGARIDNTKFYTKQVMTTGKPYSRNRKKNHPATQKAFNNEPYSMKNGGKRYPKSIIEIPPIISNSEYPTQKPLDLIRWIILASSKQNDLVLDPHVGSGTTLLGALGLCRKSIGIELYEKAYNIASKRILDAVERVPKRYFFQDTKINTISSIVAVEAI
jgi:site-specific DNA-methyltransferase (adenine-specific)